MAWKNACCKFYLLQNTTFVCSMALYVVNALNHTLKTFIRRNILFFEYYRISSQYKFICLQTGIFRCCGYLCWNNAKVQQVAVQPIVMQVSPPLQIQPTNPAFQQTYSGPYPSTAAPPRLNPAMYPVQYGAGSIPVQWYPSQGNMATQMTQFSGQKYNLQQMQQQH